MRPRRSPHAGSRRTKLAATRKSAERTIMVGRTPSVLAGVALHARVAGDGEALREGCAARTECAGAGAGRAGLRGNLLVALESDLHFGPRVLRTTLDRTSNRCAGTPDYPWTELPIGGGYPGLRLDRLSNRSARGPYHSGALFESDATSFQPVLDSVSRRTNQCYADSAA